MVTALAPQNAQFTFFGLNTLRKGYEQIINNPFFKRVTEHWQTSLMMATTVISVISFAVAFFAGSTFLTVTCFLIASGCAIGTLCMYHFSDLKSLRKTAEEFGEERQRLTVQVQNLNEENQTYKANNIELQETTDQLRKEMTEQNQVFKENNDVLEKTNAGLKQTSTTFEKEAEKLKAQILVLKESAETIRQQLEQTTVTNTISKENALEIRAQLNVWKVVQAEIGEQFKDQGTEMDTQLKELGTAVQEIFKQTAIREKYEQLKTFQTDLNQTKDNLKNIELAIAEKQAALKEIHDVYVQMLDAMKAQVKEIGTANTQHREHNDNLGNQIGDLTKLIAAIRPFLPTKEAIS
jgi:chromosome segregation ATPase